MLIWTICKACFSRCVISRTRVLLKVSSPCEPFNGFFCPVLCSGPLVKQPHLLICIRLDTQLSFFVHPFMSCTMILDLFCNGNTNTYTTFSCCFLWTFISLVYDLSNCAILRFWTELEGGLQSMQSSSLTFDVWYIGLERTWTQLLPCTVSWHLPSCSMQFCLQPFKLCNVSNIISHVSEDFTLLKA